MTRLSTLLKSNKTERADLFGSFFIFIPDMRILFDKIPPIFRNFYFVCTLFFLVWMLFFDSNDLITQIKLTHKQSELQSTKGFYQDQILEVKNDRESLLSDEQLLEKLAREKYLMKKEKEDIFIVVEE